MKKIVQIGIIIQLLLITGVSLSVMQEVSLTCLLYQDASKLTLLMPKPPKIRELDKQKDYLKKVAVKNHLLISKYVYKSDKQLTIYSTDTTLNGKIIPFSRKAPLISKKDFVWDGEVPQLTIKDWDTVTETGIAGIYYIKGLSSKNQSSLVAQIEKNLGEVRYESSVSFVRMLLENILGDYSLIVLLILVILINCCMFLIYLIYQTKRVAILISFGWNKRKIANYFMKPFLVEIVISTFVICLGISSYWFLFRGGFYTFDMLNTVLWLTSFMMLVAVYLIITIFLKVFQTRKLYQKINGEKKVLFALIFSNVIKMIAFAIILLLSVMALKNYSGLQQMIESQKYWDQTKNIYATQTRFITNDMEAYRPYEKQLKQFYKLAVEKKGLFIFAMQHYQKIDSGKFIYEANTERQEKIYQEISPNGKNVRINLNYLLKNPIKKIKGEVVSAQDLDYSDTTWNLLVPQCLQKYESKIKELYLKEFAFNKFLFEKERKEDGTYDTSGLSIHIIYIQDDQTYFTFNPQIINEENRITVPISIVDTGNLDASFYSSLLSNSAFVESDKTDGYTYLLPIVKETNTAPSIQNTVSLYDFKAQEIQDKKKFLSTVYMVLVILILVMLLSVFSGVSLFIEKNRKKFSVQTVFGYLALDLLFPYCFIQLGLTIVSGLGVFLFMPSLVVLLLTGSWIVFELVGVSIYGYWLFKAVNINQEIKGE